MTTKEQATAHNNEHEHEHEEQPHTVHAEHATDVAADDTQRSIEVIVQRVGLSRRYRGVDPHVISRVARGVLPQSSSLADAEKRTKRRLHQMFGAYTGVPEYARHLIAIQHAWRGDLHDPAFRDACRAALGSHASTRERLPLLDRFYSSIWTHTGLPTHVLDLACGLHPLTLPWMGLPLTVRYDASDIDQPLLSLVDGFFDLLNVPHEVSIADLAADTPLTFPRADVAFVLKTVPPLDQQQPTAAARLLRTLPARHIVLSFPTRSLGGHSRGMQQSYRARAERLLEECADVVADHAVITFPGELVYIVTRANAPMQQPEDGAQHDER